MKLALLTTDNRWVFRDYTNPNPYFGPAPAALLEGLVNIPELEVHIVSCIRQPVTAPEKLAPNIWFHSLHVPKLGWLRTAYQGCIRAVRKKLREIRPDIVHGQGTECDHAVEAIFSGFPNVLTLHGNMEDAARLMHARFGSYYWFTARFENLALKRTAGVFCNSTYTDSRVRPRARRTWLVPNALRGKFFSEPRRATREKRCVLLQIGQVCENKQQIKTLELARSLHRKGLDFEMRFIGGAHPDNAYAQRFRHEIAAAEQDGYARFLGAKSADEMIECMDRASALVHTPIAETFGLVVAESLSRDLKVFGLSVGGLRDIVEGVDGSVLVGEQDWQALETAVETWIRAGHPPPGPAAQLMRQRYHPDSIARHHIEIYREVLGVRA